MDYRKNSTTTFKYLGVHLVIFWNPFQQNLHVYKKAAGRVTLLRKIRPSVTWAAEKGIYRAMIMPVFTDRSLITLSYSNNSLDYQPLFGKGARAPAPFFSGRVDQIRESGGNRAYSNKRRQLIRNLKHRGLSCISSALEKKTDYRIPSVDSYLKRTRSVRVFWLSNWNCMCAF